MKYSSRIGVFWAVSFVAMSMSLQGTAAAQVVADEIIVTAEKREQDIADVGITVTAFSGEQIKELGFTNSTDIAQQTPGLNVIQFHPTVTNIVIRGVSQNEFADHLEPPIALYVDDAYVSSMGAAHTQIFDLERVEVLKGPQGTLFGRNATGGLIHYISAKPTEEAEGYVDFTYGSFNQVKIEGAVSGPLGDNIQGRLSAGYNRHDGVLENRIGDDVRDANALSIRGQLALHPSDRSNVLLKGYYSRDDSNGNSYSHAAAVLNADGVGRFLAPREDAFGTCAQCDLMGYREPDDDPFTGSFDNPGFFEREIVGATGKFTYELSDNLTLTSVTDYFELTKSYEEDTDASPFPFFDFRTNEERQQFSQEVRLSGEYDRLFLQGGLYYLNIDNNVDSEYDLDISFFVDGTDFGQYINTGSQSSTIDSQSWALFAHSEYALTPQLSVIGAVRYTDDTRDLVYNVLDVETDVVDLFGFGAGAVFVNNDDSNLNNPASMPRLEFENWSAKAQLEWKPTDSTLVYAGYNRGHKAGNWRLPIGGFPDLAGLPHDDEVLSTVEGGIKTSFANDRVRLNIAAFYYDYDDYQAFTVDASSGNLATFDLKIINVDATAKGVEFELSALPFDGLQLLLGASIMDSEVSNVALPGGRVVDTELPYAPGFAANGMARYGWDAFGGEIFVQGEFNYSGDFCFTVLCAPLDLEDSYLVGNIRAGYVPPSEKWRVTGFVNNVGDTKYRLYALDAAGLGIANNSFANPRWYGVTFGVNF